ncbi:LLM class flavin-dependent oxidoreductase [Herbiconiux ginsengi]|uniref:FMNH2-dependent dimethyl sulfone monooxygenase n=1 Tax=Herbiconiux ginsengi TaxID=381665 RepID=A0A1H3THN4_9MICO|nr:LLM class flavin-dependent oxidoreductase [Herbiconiux ginsengi]SDZ49378.1 FMNH2-dependent dimethyl sulfone monooxygenase [Herbiconiux ginsengi]
MVNNGFKTVETMRGPFDPGGQPDLETGQPLQLGFFGWNVRAGMTASKAVLTDEARLADYWVWERSSKLIKLAEDIGFDYQVPFGRWIGGGGATNFNGAALDFLASAAATAPITERMGVISTAHITYGFHPLHIAKFGATIDHISNGRWGLNIVSGYQAQERAAFGRLDELDHDEAYDMAEEFVVLMKHLWHEKERFNFEGKYYQSYGAVVAPGPSRNPRPVLMNAGGSPKGIDFAVRNVDVVFTLAPSLEGYREKVSQIRELSTKYNRKVKIATMSWASIEATDELAEERLAWYEDQIDLEAVYGYYQALAGIDTFGAGDTSPKSDDYPEYKGLTKEFVKTFSLGMTSPRLYGSPETVAEKIRALHDVGIESLFINFADPQKGLHQMQDDVLPILRKMGLRK